MKCKIKQEIFLKKGMVDQLTCEEEFSNEKILEQIMNVSVEQSMQFYFNFFKN